MLAYGLRCKLSTGNRPQPFLPDTLIQKVWVRLGICILMSTPALPWWLRQESPCNVGDQDLIPGLGRVPEKGNDNPLQYTCLENPIDWSLAGTITRAQ